MTALTPENFLEIRPVIEVLGSPRSAVTPRDCGEIVLLFCIRFPVDSLHARPGDAQREQREQAGLKPLKWSLRADTHALGPRHFLVIHF